MNSTEKLVAFLTAMVVIQALASACMYQNFQERLNGQDERMKYISANQVDLSNKFIDYKINHASPVVLIVPDGYAHSRNFSSSEFSNEFIPNAEYYDKSYYIEELTTGSRYKISENATN